MKLTILLILWRILFFVSYLLRNCRSFSFSISVSIIFERSESGIPDEPSISIALRLPVFFSDSVPYNYMPIENNFTKRGKPVSSICLLN